MEQRLNEALDTYTHRDFVDASCGVVQGDPVATDFVCAPDHEIKHELQDKYPTLRIAGLADDGIYNAPPAVLYSAFDLKRCLAWLRMRFVSHDGKLTVLVPDGSTHLVPTKYAARVAPLAKLGGLYVGDADACSRALNAKLRNKLANLDNIDLMTDTLKVSNVRELRLDLLRDVASRVPQYWMRGMPPSRTFAAAAMADARTLKSYELIAEGANTPQPRRSVVTKIAFLASNKGGIGIYNCTAARDAEFSAFFLRAWPDLKRGSPFLASHTLADSNLATIVEMQTCYARVCTARDESEAIAVRRAKDVYYRLDGEKRERFNPKSLPPAKALPSLSELDHALATNVNYYKPPAQRKLTEVARHVAFHKHEAELAAFDAVTDAATDARGGAACKAIRHRELTRLVSRSQPLGGKWQSNKSTSTVSDLFLAALQYGTGLYLSCALDANCTLESHGQQTDWLGDHTHDSTMAAGERNVRHDAGNLAWYQAARDAIDTPVTLCVKANKRDPEAQRQALERYSHFNGTKHVPDWGARGAAPSGKHLVGEHKCYSPLVPSTPGTGSRGGVAHVGHRVAMGNTEESLVLLTLGVKQRGLPSDRAFDHTTNIGYVPPHDGHYSDGLAKGNTILLLISEIFGAVNGVSLRFLTRLAHRFKGCKDIKYHDRGGREVSFFLHYARAISTAAAIGHARVLVKHAAGLNRRAALFRARVRAAPSPPAAVALADDFLNTLGAGMAAGRA